MSENNVVSFVERGTSTAPGLWNEDAERAVLAALLMQQSDHRLGTQLDLVLSGAMFYRGAHRAMYEAIASLRAANAPVDPLTLANALEAAGQLTAAGGKVYIGQLLGEIPTDEHAAAHAAIVREYHRRRELLALATQLAGQAKDLSAPVDAAYDWASRALMESAHRKGDQGFEHIKGALYAAMERIEARETGQAPVGITTGLPELDTALGGAPMPGNLVIVCGVPGCGKTSVVWNILLDTALSGVGATAFVSAEMTSGMLTESALASVAGVRRSAIAAGQMTKEESGRLVQALSDMARSPIYLKAEPRPRVEDVLTRCRLLKAQHPNLRAIGVDFLQLLQKRDERRGDLREQVYRDISYDFQGLAIELDVVIYLLVQPNSKQIAARPGDKRPQLSDIAGSQGPEEAATIALLMYRDKMYNPGASDELEITVAKNKFGPVGNVARLRWEGHYVRPVSPQRQQLELEARRERDQPLTLSGATA